MWAHFDFEEPAFVAPPALMVEPVTLPPTATPPPLASIAGAVIDFDAGTK
jgi:hypothetical protein